MDKNSVLKGRKGHTEHHSINSNENHSVKKRGEVGGRERKGVASYLIDRRWWDENRR